MFLECTVHLCNNKLTKCTADINVARCSVSPPTEWLPVASHPDVLMPPGGASAAGSGVVAMAPIYIVDFCNSCILPVLFIFKLMQYFLTKACYCMQWHFVDFHKKAYDSSILERHDGSSMQTVL